MMIMIMPGHEWGAEGVRGDAAGQPDGQDAETGQRLSHPKILNKENIFSSCPGSDLTSEAGRGRETRGCGARAAADRGQGGPGGGGVE